MTIVEERVDSAVTTPSLAADPIPGRAWKGRALGVLLGLSTSAAAGWLTLRDVDLPELVTRISQAHLGWLLMVPALAIPVQLLLAYRSRLLMKNPLARKATKAPFPALLFSHILAFVGNTLIPLRAGELLRIDYLARRSKLPHSSCLAITGIERLFDMIFMVLCFFASVGLSSGRVPGAVVISLLGVVCSGMLLLMVLLGHYPEGSEAVLRKLVPRLPQRIANWANRGLHNFIRGFQGLDTVSAALGVAFTTAVRWFLGLMSLYVVQRAFDLDLPWFTPIVLLTFSAFGTAIPSTVAFAGTYHYSIVAGLAVVGVDSATAVSFAVVLHAFVFLPTMAVSTVWVALALAHGSYHLPTLQRIERPDPAPR